MRIEAELPGAKVVFSTRIGGVSEGPYESLNLGILTDDQPGRVKQNRNLLAETCGLGADDIAMGWQVHGTAIREWEEPPRGGYSDPGVELDRVDAHVTALRRIGLLVLVADCIPLALADGERVAMVHCGWRGLAGGIVAKVVEAFNSAPTAVIGPGIGPCCYEVGREVLVAFDEIPGAARGRMLDLKRVTRAKLEAAGVERIEDVDLCTSCQTDLFFSHRRDNGVTGRQGGIAWLK